MFFSGDKLTRTENDTPYALKVRGVSFAGTVCDGSSSYEGKDALLLSPRFFAPSDKALLERTISPLFAGAKNGLLMEQGGSLISTISGNVADVLVIENKTSTPLSIESVVKGTGALFRLVVLFARKGSILYTSETGDGLEHVIAFVGEGKSVDIVQSSNKGTARLEADIFLEEKNGKGSISLKTERSGGVLDVRHTVHHTVSYTEASIGARGVLGGNTRVIYRADIDIPHGTEGAVGTQDAQFLMMSKDARVDAVPALDIKNNHVVSSHALGITRIKPEHLFYATSRGIDSTRAERMVVEGFLGYKK